MAQAFDDASAVEHLSERVRDLECRLAVLERREESLGSAQPKSAATSTALSPPAKPVRARFYANSDFQFVVPSLSLAPRSQLYLIT